MATLNVRDANTGKFVSVDVTNPSGNMLINDKDTFMISPSLDRSPTVYKNVVVVDKSGKGDYTSVRSAVNSISDSGPSKRYTILVMPGVYTETAYTDLKDCMDIVAYIPGTVTIKATNSSLYRTGITFNVPTGVTLYGLNLESTDGAIGSTVVFSSGRVSIVTINNCNILCNSGQPALATAGTLASKLTIINSTIRCGETGGTSVLNDNSSWPILIRNCTFIQDQSPTSTYSCILLSHATPALTISYSSLYGGQASFRAASAKTAAIYHCVMNKNYSSVSSSVVTPCNVIDTNL